MRVIGNLDTLLIESNGALPPSSEDTVGGRQGVRGRLFSEVRFEVGFSREAENDVLVDLGEDPGLELILKRDSGTQKFDGPVLQMAVGFARVAEGDGFYYWGTLDLSAAVFQKLLGVDDIAQKEQVTIQTLADTGNSVRGVYFDLYHGTGATDFQRFWFYDGTGSAPASGGGSLVQVTFTTGATASGVATSLETAFSGNAYWDVSRVSDVVTVTAKSVGAKGWHHARRTGFTMTVTAAGMTGDTTADEEQVSVLAELSFEQDGDRQILEIFDFVIENTLRRPGQGAPGASGGTNVREGSAAISNGASEVAVTFGSAFPSAGWKLLSAQVANTTDTTPAAIMVGTMKARSSSGCTLLLSGPTDSANYTLEYVAKL